jgi:hypothetical protein
VEGEGPPAARVTALLLRQRDMALVHEAAGASVHLLAGGDAASAPAAPATVRLGPGPGPLFHSAWSAGPAPAEGVRIPSPAGCAALRALRAVSGVARVHMVSLRPAPGPGGRPAGPIDALVPDDPPPERPPWPPGADWTVQEARVPHTRCWLVACAVECRRPAVRAELLSRLSRVPRVLLAPARLGFTDSAVLAEFFRDLGRPDGSFWETVVFSDSLVACGSTVRFWAAAHESSAAAEAIDAVRVLARTASPARSAALTSLALREAGAAAALEGLTA